jgi:hypothetical protein
MSTPSTPRSNPARGAARTAREGQRFGHISGRPPADGPGAHPDAYLVRDDKTGLTYWFGYTDIVTEGLRTIRTGERVRFLIDHANPGHASYVIRLDLPDIREYYK